jgi:hypothetical protein
MTLAIHSHAAWTGRPAAHPQRVGDAVAELGQRYAGEMVACDFARAIHQRVLPRRSYVAFLATMYPVVVGFNRALIRSIAKVDNVRNSSFVRVLARQLDEEQAHNQLWRVMLEVFGVDHEAVYGDFEEYIGALDADELDRRTRDVTARVRRDLSAGSRDVFRGSPFPDAVPALFHHLWTSASDDGITYWEHFASQAGIEMVIFDVVSSAILPGVSGHPELDLGVASTRWWTEHGAHPREQDDQSERPRTDEEKHLALSRAALNRSETANAISQAVAARAEDTMRLFAATLIAQHPRQHAFPIERYTRGA